MPTTWWLWTRRAPWALRRTTWRTPRPSSMSRRCSGIREKRVCLETSYQLLQSVIRLCCRVITCFVCQKGEWDLLQDKLLLPNPLKLQLTSRIKSISHRRVGASLSTKRFISVSLPVSQTVPESQHHHRAHAPVQHEVHAVPSQGLLLTRSLQTGEGELLRNSAWVSWSVIEDWGFFLS